MTLNNHTGKKFHSSGKPVERNKEEEVYKPASGFEDAQAILGLLLSNSKELFILLDYNYRIQFINENSKKQFATLFNIDLQKGQNLLEVASEQNRPFIKEIYDDVLKGNTRETESSHVVNGKTIYLRNTFRPAKNEHNQIIGIIISAHDITTVKQNQITLEEAELGWQFASEGSTQGLWDWNIQTGYTYYSKSYKRLYGFNDDELKDHIDEWSSRIHPDDREITSKALKNHFLNSEPTYDSTYRVKGKDGNYRWILSRGMIVSRDENGQPVRMIGTHTDITRYKATEENYKLLFYSNPLPMWTIDPETLRFLEVNDQAVAHYGYSREEFLSMAIKDIFLDKENLDPNLIFDNAKKSSSHFVLSGLKHQKKDGTIIYVDITGLVIEQEGRSISLVTCQDVTDKLLAEQRLLNSEIKYRTLFVNYPLPSWIYNPKTQQVLEVNEAAVAHYGYTKEEFKQLTIRELHPLNERPSAERAIYESLKKQTSTGQWQHQKKNGDIIYIEVRSSKIEYQNQEARLVVIHDRTNQVRAESELLKSNERFDAVLKATNDLIWDWNLETGHSYRDAGGLKKVYGVANEADIQSIYTWLQRIHPDDSSHVQHVINEILHSKDQDTFEVEYRFRRDDNHYNFVYDRGIIIRNAEGKPVRMIGAAQDITERKRLEIQLLKKELDKQKLISQATIETQEQERTEIGKELHDNVNQVLTTTKLYLDLSLSNAELKDELILKSSKNIIYVINEIRQLSRSLMNPSLGDLGLVESIHELIDNINLTGRLKARLQVTPSLDNTLSENQKLMVYRIVQEAINNALKHAKAQNVIITIHDYDDCVELFIEDDGIGFNFDTVKKGSGLKHIQNRVYLANGTLNVNSAPGKGCLIMINFPKHTNPI